jgi:hypothetical protein
MTPSGIKPATFPQSGKPITRTKPKLWKRENCNFDIIKVTHNEWEVTQITVDVHYNTWMIVLCA